MNPQFNAQQIAQTVITFPNGLTSEIVLWLEEDGYEIGVEDELHSGWVECGCCEIEAQNEDDARKLFVIFVITHRKQEMSEVLGSNEDYFL